MPPLLALLALPPALAAPAGEGCPQAPLDTLVAEAERSVLEGRLEDTPGALEGVDARLACGPAATPPQVARALLVDGLFRHFSGEAEGAALAFASAHRLDASAFNPDYGAAVRAVYDAAVAAAPSGAGALTLEPALHPELAVVLDGAPVALPAEVPVGLHVLQVVEHDGPAVYAGRPLVLDPGEQVVVNTGPLAPRPITDAPAPLARKPAWPLLSAGGLALAAGGTALWARSRRGPMSTAPSVDALNTAYGQQKALNAATWTLAGLSTVGLGVWAVW